MLENRVAGGGLLLTYPQVERLADLSRGQPIRNNGAACAGHDRPPQCSTGAAGCYLGGPPLLGASASAERPQNIRAYLAQALVAAVA